MNDRTSFSISVDGEITKEKYLGEFTVKTMLSHRDSIVRDSKRREILGETKPEYASEDVTTLATVLSELFVRVVQAPDWFRASNNGMDLLDTTPLYEIYKKAMEAENAVFAKIKKDGEEAKQDIKKATEAE